MQQTWLVAWFEELSTFDRQIKLDEFDQRTKKAEKRKRKKGMGRNVCTYKIIFSNGWQKFTLKKRKFK